MSKKLKSYNLKSFSLLELLIYIALLGIVLLFIASTFISLGRGRGTNEARSEVTSNLRFAIEKITNDVRAASSVTTPASPGGTTSPTLVMTVSGSTITYDVSGGQLRRQVGVAAPEPLTSSLVTVSTPTFTRLENTNTTLGKTVFSIEIDLTASYNSTSPDYQYTERKKTSATLR